MNHINLFSLAKKLSNHETAIEWCREIELIPREKWCIRHKRPMVYVEEEGGLGRFRCCKNKKYNHSIAVAHNTWLLLLLCFVLSNLYYAFQLPLC